MLATAPPVFAYCTDNHPTPASQILNADGTAFTAGGNSTDGTAVTLLSALAHDVHYLRLRLNHVFASTADGNAVGDLLVDPAGGASWSALINDLACGFTPSATTAGAGTAGGAAYDFPLYIKAGTSIGWRAKTAHTADITTGLALIEVFGEPSRPEMWWCGSGVETLGVSDAKGTAVSPGNATFGSWASVGSPTTRHIRSVQLGINGSDSTSFGRQYRVEFGHGSARLPGSPAHHLTFTTTEYANRITVGATSCNIPVGTQMQARAYGDGAGENFYVGLYGTY